MHSDYLLDLAPMGSSSARQKRAQAKSAHSLFLNMLRGSHITDLDLGNKRGIYNLCHIRHLGLQKGGFY